MSYLRVNGDGSTTDMGVIIGYRVQYKGPQGQQKTSKAFTYFWQANRFKNALRLSPNTPPALRGSDGIVVPLYQGDKTAKK